MNRIQLMSKMNIMCHKKQIRKNINEIASNLSEKNWWGQLLKSKSSSRIFQDIIRLHNHNLKLNIFLLNFKEWNFFSFHENPGTSAMLT